SSTLADLTWLAFRPIPSFRVENHLLPTWVDLSALRSSASAPDHSVTISGAQSIMDGQQGTFSVSASSGTATAYKRSFVAPGGAGNSPNVNFGSPTSARTSTDGHWFALVALCIQCHRQFGSHAFRDVSVPRG